MSNLKRIRDAAIAAFFATSICVASAQVNNPGIQQSGSVTAGHCAKWGPGTGQMSDAGAACATAAGANPTATATTTAVNGTSNNFMRSDAAPAIASTTFGGQSVGPGGSAIVQGNGAKIQLSTGSPVSGNCGAYDASGNIIDAGAPCGGAAGANPTATAGATATNGTASTFMRSDAAPAVAQGTNAVKGIVEGDGTSISLSSGVASSVKAAKSDMQAGTDGNKSVVPSVVNQADGVAKAWVNFVGSSGVINASYNVSSVTRSAAGTYVVNFTTPFASAFFTCTANGMAGGGQGIIALYVPASTTASTLGVDFFSQSFALADPIQVNVVCFGRQ
jgi:hypothetical protein